MTPTTDAPGPPECCLIRSGDAKPSIPTPSPSLRSTLTLTTSSPSPHRYPIPHDTCITRLFHLVQIREFFSLPVAEKAAVKRTADNSRGWFNDELTKQTRDWKECIDVGPLEENRAAAAATSHKDGVNQWPAEEVLPGFRKAVEDYYSSCTSLSASLLRACAAGLQLGTGREADVPFDTAEEAFGTRAFSPHTSYLRVNFYDVCPTPVADDWGASDAGSAGGAPDVGRDGYLSINQHTDAGALTVLRQWVLCGDCGCRLLLR